MSLKPIAPKGHQPKRGVRPAGAPVVLVQKKSSGGGGIIVVVLLLLALGGGYFVYNNQQKNEAALAAQQQRLEENAARKAEAERQRAEHEARMEQQKAERAAAKAVAAAPTAAPAVDETPATASAAPAVAPAAVAEEEEEGPKSAMGSTSAPTAGDGVFRGADTTPPPYDLTAKGKAAAKVMAALEKAIDKAGDDNTFHDLQADLKRSFEVAYPDLYANAGTLPSFPPREEKLLRMAQGVYTCLVLAAELEARNTVPDREHARFVNWIMKERAKAARTFTYGVVEHCGIHDTATAADLLDEVRQAYLISPTSGMKKIPAILKERAKQ